MKKYFFSIIVIVVFSAFCNIVKAAENTMFLTTQADGKVFLKIRGTGSINIDWGDGSAIKTYKFKASCKTIKIKHKYS